MLNADNLNQINACAIHPEGHAATDTPTGEPHTEHTPLSIDEQLAMAESLVNDLKRLLVRHEVTLEEEGIRSQIETLERWMESYRRGLAAAHKVSEVGPTWLCELKERLKLAADELTRLEDEGGNPSSGDQSRKAEELLKASRRINEVLPTIEQVFGKTPEACTEQKEPNHA